MLRHTSLFVAALLVAAGAEAQVRPLSHDRQNAAGARSATISQSIPREADRLVAAERLRMSLGDSIAQDAAPARSAWSDVRDLDPPEMLLVTRHGGESGTRYLVRADEAGLEVLNLTGLAISADTTNALLDVAEDHPDYFDRARQGETFPVGKNMRLGPEGLFLAESKIADLEQIVENIPRNDISEISLFETPIRRYVRRGLIVGGIVGAVIGAFSRPTEEYSRGFNVVALGGVVGGFGAAGGVMFGAAAPREPVVIYRDTRHPSASIGAMRAARGGR